MRLETLVVVACGYRLGGEKAWRVGSNEYRDIRNDNDDAWKVADKTLCYSGNELYEQKKVFCDAECIAENGNDELCNGPWYCSKAEICQEFRTPRGYDTIDPIQRRCVVVRSCANHSQCFPNDNQAAADGVVLVDDEWATKSQVRRQGYDVSYAGMTMNTVCCKNRRTFKSDKDLPCNGASSASVGWLPVLAAIFVFARIR